MGGSACTCTLPPEVQRAAEEATCPKAGPQARPTPLQEERRGGHPHSVPRSSSQSTEGEFDRMFSTTTSEASPRSQECAPAGPPCDLDQDGANRFSPTAPPGSPTDSPVTAQAPISVARKSETQEAPRAMTAAHPDFSGDWLLHRLEGDVQAMLMELETSLVQRKALASVGFGVGLQSVHVEQHTNEIRIDSRYLSGKVEMPRPRSTSNIYRTDGIEQYLTDLDGRTVRTRVTWDGQVLSMDSERVWSSRPLPSTRRYLQGDGEELVFEQTSLTTGVSVKQIFRRCESPAAEDLRSPAWSSPRDPSGQGQSAQSFRPRRG